MTIGELSKKHNLPINRLQYREDGRVEWVCDHGVGHTIYHPDKNTKYGFVHGCDGCCSRIKIQES